MSDTVVEDFLAHHGVVGMKWGKRRSSGTSGPSSSGLAPAPSRKEKRVANNNAILDARSRHNARIQKIINADQDVQLATTAKGKKAALSIVEKYAKEIATSNDAAIGSKRTTGEKWATGLTFAAVGLTAVGMLVPKS